MKEYEKTDISFNGEFTAEIRRRLKAKRVHLGLSCMELGELLGVSWVTVRKWEHGEISRCRCRHAAAVERFLSGKYDRITAADMEIAENTRKSGLLEGLRSAYELCTDNPEIQQRLIRGMQHAVMEATGKYKNTTGKSAVFRNIRSKNGTREGT